jgi:hypothetical protein
MLTMSPALDYMAATKNVCFHGGTMTTRCRRRRKGGA